MRERLLFTVTVLAALLAIGMQAKAQVLGNSGTVYLPLVALAPSPTTAPTPTVAPTPPPPFFGDCSSTPRPSNAPNFPVQVAILNKATEEVLLENRSDRAIDLTGWKLCSLTSRKQHNIPPGTIIPARGGVLIPPSSAPVWDNVRRDDGALYDSTGRLIAYYLDFRQITSEEP